MEQAERMASAPALASLVESAELKMRRQQRRPIVTLAGELQRDQEGRPKGQLARLKCPAFATLQDFEGQQQEGPSRGDFNEQFTTHFDATTNKTTTTTATTTTTTTTKTSTTNRSTPNDKEEANEEANPNGCQRALLSDGDQVGRLARRKSEAVARSADRRAEDMTNRSAVIWGQTRDKEEEADGDYKDPLRACEWSRWSSGAISSHSRRASSPNEQRVGQLEPATRIAPDDYGRRRRRQRRQQQQQQQRPCRRIIEPQQDDRAPPAAPRSIVSSSAATTTTSTTTTTGGLFAYMRAGRRRHSEWTREADEDDGPTPTNDPLRATHNDCNKSCDTSPAPTRRDFKPVPLTQVTQERKRHSEDAGGWRRPSQPSGEPQRCQSESWMRRHSASLLDLSLSRLLAGKCNNEGPRVRPEVAGDTSVSQYSSPLRLAARAIENMQTSAARQSAGESGRPAACVDAVGRRHSTYMLPLLLLNKRRDSSTESDDEDEDEDDEDDDNAELTKIRRLGGEAPLGRPLPNSASSPSALNTPTNDELVGCGGPCCERRPIGGVKNIAISSAQSHSHSLEQQQQQQQVGRTQVDSTNKPLGRSAKRHTIVELLAGERHARQQLVASQQQQQQQQQQKPASQQRRSLANVSSIAGADFRRRMSSLNLGASHSLVAPKNHPQLLMEQQVEYEPLIPESGFKIVIMGTSGSGKTAIIQRFLYGTFSARHQPTVEDTYFIEFPYQKQLINISVSDTSGTYQFPAMRKLAINSGDAFILVYSVDEPQSFEDLEQLRQTILDEREQAYLDSINASAASAGPTQAPAQGLAPTMIVGNNNDQAAPSSSSHSSASSASSSSSSSSPGSSQSLGLAPPPRAPGSLTPTGKLKVQPLLQSQSQKPRQLNQLHPTMSLMGRQQANLAADLSPSRHWSLAALFNNNNNNNNNNNHHHQHQQQRHSSNTANQILQQQLFASSPASHHHHHHQANSLNSSLCSTTSTSCSSSADNSRRSSISAAEAALRTRRTRKPPMVIVANKHDLPRDRHRVNSDEIEALAVIDWNNGFVRASAALNWNIDEIFQQVLKQARQPPTLAEAIVSKRRKSLPPKLPQHP